MDDHDNRDPIEGNNSDYSDDEIRDILREALTLQIREKRKIPKKAKLKEVLCGNMAEFLSCFKLIGYDIDGDPVVMTYHTSNLEKSALDNAFSEEMVKFMHGKMPNNGK